MSIEFLYSTGIVVNRDVIGDYTKLFDRIEKVDNSLLEFIVYRNWYDNMEDILRRLCNTGKRVPVFHSAKMIGDNFYLSDKKELGKYYDEFAKNCEYAVRLNSERIVLHLWEISNSDRNIENNILAAFKCSEIAKEHSLILSVETIPCEISTPISVLKMIREAGVDCGFTLDTKHLASHKEISRIKEDWLWDDSYPELHFHIRDYVSEEMQYGSLHPGEGNIDFQDMLKFVQNKGEHNYITLEASSVKWEGEMFLHKCDQSIEYMKSLLR